MEKCVDNIDVLFFNDGDFVGVSVLDFVCNICFIVVKIFMKVVVYDLKF